MRMKDWVQLPSVWIRDGGLKNFQWANSGADNTAALMVLAPIAHHVGDDGISVCTYDKLSTATGLSRSKVANGLSILAERQIIEREPAGRSTFKLIDYERPDNWAKLPARRMYSGGRIDAFQDFTLRTIGELHALKLYYLFARLRDKKTNMAQISYEKIEAHTDIAGARIKRAISILAAAGLVLVEHMRSTQSEHGVASAYRLAHLNPTRHLGTSGRDPDFGKFWTMAPSDTL